MNTKNKARLGEEAIFSLKQISKPQALLLGLQHTFAMFGATVLVPLITGLQISTSLLMAGLGTLIFHLITGGSVPIFLGSSFAFLGGYAAVAPVVDGVADPSLLAKANGGYCNFRDCVFDIGSINQIFRSKESNAFFPAGSYRTDHYFDRFNPSTGSHF